MRDSCYALQAAANAPAASGLLRQALFQGRDEENIKCDTGHSEASDLNGFTHVVASLQPLLDCTSASIEARCSAPLLATGGTSCRDLNAGNTKHGRGAPRKRAKRISFDEVGIEDEHLPVWPPHGTLWTMLLLEGIMAPCSWAI